MLEGQDQVFDEEVGCRLAARIAVCCVEVREVDSGLKIATVVGGCEVVVVVGVSRRIATVPGCGDLVDQISCEGVVEAGWG